MPSPKNSLSFFLNDLISEAHSLIGEEALSSVRAKAHEIRAVSTSLAFNHDLSLSSVLQATYWRCKSVFSTHYLHDVEATFEICSTLGLLSMGGMVLGREHRKLFFLPFLFALNSGVEL